MPGNYPPRKISGALFEKQNASPNAPAFTGFIEIEGVKHNIVLWHKTSGKGLPYLQVAEDKRKNEQEASGGNAYTQKTQTTAAPQYGQKRPAKPEDFDPDDSIPF